MLETLVVVSEETIFSITFRRLEDAVDQARRFGGWIAAEADAGPKDEARWFPATVTPTKIFDSCKEKRELKIGTHREWKA